jgi:hypothetical protein
MSEATTTEAKTEAANDNTNAADFLPEVTDAQMDEASNPREIVNVTESEMVRIINDLKSGTTFVSVDMETCMDDKGMMVKKDRDTGEPNPHLNTGLVKYQTINGCLGYDYGNAKRKAVEKKGENPDDVTVQSRPWGKATRFNPETGERETARLNPETERFEWASVGADGQLQFSGEKASAYKLVEHRGKWYIHMCGYSYNGKVIGVAFGIPVYMDAEGRVYEKAQLGNVLKLSYRKDVNCHDASMPRIVRIRMNHKEYVVGNVQSIPVEHRQLDAQTTEQITAGVQG